MNRYVKVVFNLPLREHFTYEIPPSLAVPPIGGRVLAPFGHKASQLGFTVGYCPQPDLEQSQIKPIENVLDEDPVFSPEMMKLLTWIAGYYYCSLGEVLFAAFPFGSRTGYRSEQVIVPGDNFQNLLLNKKLTPSRRKVMELFAQQPGMAGWSLSQIQKRTGVSHGVIAGLIQLGGLKKSIVRKQTTSAAENLYYTPPPELNDAQIQAVNQILQSITQRKPKVHLLHGVTGSGKTEVFLKSIEKILEMGRTALVLVPEIALTPQTAARYRGRFPGLVEVLHSGLSQTHRYEAWCRVRNGEVKVVVGTRSAVFAPLPELGLIIVDEEHDPSYKQADPAPRYHGRDVAIYRGLLENAVVVLGSATPSLESYENTIRRKSNLIVMPERATAHPLPEVRLIDMRHCAPTEKILSTPVRQAIQETLGMGLQSIIFLNRRGHSTHLTCRDCGTSLECPHCSVALVWHEALKTLMCHHCGFVQEEPDRCPSCKSNWIRSRGFGTEQVSAVIQTAFPGARVERIDLDTTREVGAHDRILSAFRKREIDILVGTQMVSKGLDMPGVRLVAVIQAETSLNIADFRSAERSFALLTQVAGRAGRGDHPGLVLVQSYTPNHYSIHLALRHDYLTFRKMESRIRFHLGLPPYTSLVNIRAEGEKNEKVEGAIRQLATAMNPLIEELKEKGCRLIGPAPCPLEKIANQFRWQLQLVVRDRQDRIPILNQPEVHAKLVKPPGGVRFDIDVDPLNLL